jgi:catechol 2,3-dioxygenase-like lactoylglutathione lyase family enzyme
MAVQFNHTVISAKDSELTANFYVEILGLDAPGRFGPFIVIKTDNDVNLDFVTTSNDIPSRHFAFLVSEPEFDDIFERILKNNILYWSDHKRENPREINNNDGGRGLYFLDPNGHFLEVITRPYGSQC